MKKTKLFFLICVLFLTGSIFLAVWNLNAIERLLLERSANFFARPFFLDSIRMESVRIDSRFRIHVKNMTGAFQARQGPVFLIIQSAVSEDSLGFFLQGKPVRFLLKGIRPQQSPRAGLTGRGTVSAGRFWKMDFSADFDGTDLEDFQWLDPQDLKGATGAMKGKLSFSQKADQEPVLEMELEAPKPGGLIQARFFDLFLPYLPQSVQKERVIKLVASKDRMVHYQTAELKVKMLQSDRMKVLLRILVLDYNLNLTLNVEVRTDAKNAFPQIAQLLGLIEVRGT